MISFENNLLRLNSGILEENFGKMSFSSIITEEGVLVKAKKSEDIYSFEYSLWSFNDVQSFDTESGRKVFFCGQSPFSKTPESLVDLIEKQNSFKAGLAAIRIFTDACQDKRPLPLNGAGGILFEFTNDTDFTALFLPEKLWLGAAAGKPDEEKALQINWWINPTLNGTQALRFARSNLAYRILTGRLPFGTVDTVERNADILDKKFLPVELAIPEIDKALAEKINSELELNSSKVVIPGKKERKSLTAKINDERPKNESDAQRAARLQEAYHKAVSVFPSELLEEEQNKAVKLTDADFGTKASEYMAKKSAQIKTKRRIRRNTSTIIAVTSIFLVISYITIQTIKTNGSDKTSKGLTAEETTEAYYQSINNLDTVFLSSHGKGKRAGEYANIVSQMYVIGKSRQAYSRDSGIQSPAGYFMILKDETKINECGLYGLTGLKINGQEKDMNVVIPVKNDKKKAITHDKGIEVYNNMNSIQKVEFFMVHSEGDAVFCENQTDTVTLTFKKDKWIITDIKSSAEPIKIDSEEFFRVYFAALELVGDSRTAVRILSGTYPWLPSDKAFDVEIQRRETITQSLGLN